jgi:hypothetical protein
MIPLPGFHIDFAVSALIVLLLVIVAAATAAFYYRTTVPAIARSRRILLATLRGTALGLIVLLLCEPLLHLLSSSVQPPVLAVLVDNSRSMRITDRAGDRASRLRELLRSEPLHAASERADLRFYTFGVSLRPFPFREQDTLGLTENATNISAALQALAREKELHHISAALLLTDGTYNLGQNPVYDAERTALPLYTIGVGDSTEQTDLVVTRVVANTLVYSDTPTPVDVTIKSSGFDGERVDVTLLSGKTELARSPLLIERGTREQTVRLSYTPEGEGKTRYTVQVSALNGELTTANNHQSFVARILKSKLRIVVIAGSPGPDVAVVRQTLAEEKDFDVRCFTQRQPSGFFEGQLQRASLDTADCIVLIGFPTAVTSRQVLEMIGAADKPILFIGGKALDDGKLRALLPALPFAVELSSSTEQLVYIQPSEAQRWNPLLHFDSPDGFDAWKRLPPIFKTLGVVRARPEAVTLGTCRFETAQTQEPLMLARSVGRERSLAIIGYGIWRWRVMAQGSPETARVLPQFLSGAMKWLTAREDARLVQVSPARDLFFQGEPVDFTGQAYDDAARPVDNARITVAIQQQGNTYETQLRPVGNGRYEGKIDGLGEGDYSFRASAEANGIRLGEDRGRFSVGGLNLEYQDTRANLSLLRLLARRTGGRFFLPAELPGLDSALAAQPALLPHVIQRVRDIDLWNWKVMLAAIIALLATEWIIRRRTGMI